MRKKYCWSYMRSPFFNPQSLNSFRDKSSKSISECQMELLHWILDHQALSPFLHQSNPPRFPHFSIRVTSFNFGGTKTALDSYAIWSPCCRRYKYCEAPYSTANTAESAKETLSGMPLLERIQGFARTVDQSGGRSLRNFTRRNKIGRRKFRFQQ